MSYIDNNIMVGEQVVYRTRLHWIIFFWPMVLFIFSLLFLFSEEGVRIIGAVLILIATVKGLSSFVNFVTSEFGITNKRIIGKVGFIRRASIEVLLSKVEAIQIDQGLLGRMLDFGSIAISGTGGTKDPFHKISSPLKFRTMVHHQIALS